MVGNAAGGKVDEDGLPLRKLLRGMRRVRAFEERVGELFSRAALPRHSHLYLGEEAIAVGACCAVRGEDYATSTHRGHGHLIAKGAGFERAFAEIAGKATGYCKGKGGTMHVADLSLGFLGAISIVGGGIPIAVGGGLSAQVRGTDQVTLCFFGDGAANQGNFGEGLNVAGIWKLPVIFICENNQYNEYTPTGRVTAGPTIAARAAGYGMPGLVVDGNDAVAVYQAVREAEDRANKVERQVGKSAAALLLEPRIGDRFDAIVTGASDKGTWVRILRPPVEGKLVHGADGLDVGDRLHVELIGTNVEQGHIDFVKANGGSQTTGRMGSEEAGS